MDIKVSMVLPAFNEEKRIEKTLNSYIPYFDKKMPGEYEIIVVCDGCTDKTPEIVKEFGKINPNVRCLEFPQKLGKGGGTEEGLKVAGGEILGFVDADDAYDLRGIETLIALVETKYDCAIASKWKGASFFQVDEPFFRKVASRIWNLFLKLWLGLNFHDTIAGAKFFRRSAYEDLQPFYLKGFDFDAEILWHVSKKGHSITETFVHTKHVEGSSFKMINSIPMFIGVIKLRLKSSLN